MIDYVDALRLIEPTAEAYSTSSGDYSKLLRTDGGQIPSQAELDAAWQNRPVDFTWPTADFFDRFTAAEIIAIDQTAAVDQQVGYLRAKLFSRQTVRRLSPDLQNAMSLLVAKGLLTDDRRIEILTPTE